MKIKYICVWSINGKTYTKMFDKFFDNFDEKTDLENQVCFNFNYSSTSFSLTSQKLLQPPTLHVLSKFLRA
jgi:hypothetical protein